MLIIFPVSATCKELIFRSMSYSSRAQWCRAYEISVDADVKDTVFSAEFWPEGIYVRKFFNARNAMPRS